MTPKEVALAFMRAFWAGDLTTAESLLTDDATWVFQLGMPYAAEGRVWDARRAMAAIVRDLFSAFDPATSFAVDITSAIAEGDEVALEYRAHGRTGAGTAYENFYAAHLSIADGHVAQIRPYNDTRHMYAALAK
jgi:ketosteroid isomerase-like protein